MEREKQRGRVRDGEGGLMDGEGEIDGWRGGEWGMEREMKTERGRER